MTKPKIKLVELERTCCACPSQWEGRTENNKPVYVRYRWGYLSVRVGQKGDDIESAVCGKEVFGEQLGDGFNGSLPEGQMLSAASMIIVEEKEK